MNRKIILNGKIIEYNIEFKNVKNINLRIKPNGEIIVSANRCVNLKTIENFMYSKSKFLINAIARINEKSQITPERLYNENDVKRIIIKLCNEMYPYFDKYIMDFPEIKFRYMVSQWGNCRPNMGILTFSLYLAYVPYECIEYVVAHEFTHFIHRNHSKDFYNELEILIPDWKKRKNVLKEIIISK